MNDDLTCGQPPIVDVAIHVVKDVIADGVEKEIDPQKRIPVHLGDTAQRRRNEPNKQERSNDSGDTALILGDRQIFVPIGTTVVKNTYKAKFLQKYDMLFLER